jgi:hypothetical protein
MGRNSSGGGDGISQPFFDSESIIAFFTTVNGRPADNVLVSTPILIEVYKPIIEDVSIFREIISKLSSIQKKYWKVIVLRSNNGVFKIDGDKWRKTQDYNTSKREVQV